MVFSKQNFKSRPIFISFSMSMSQEIKKCNLKVDSMAERTENLISIGMNHLARGIEGGSA